MFSSFKLTHSAVKVLRHKQATQYMICVRNKHLVVGLHRLGNTSRCNYQKLHSYTTSSRNLLYKQSACHPHSKMTTKCYTTSLTKSTHEFPTRTSSIYSHHTQIPGVSCYTNSVIKSILTFTSQNPVRHLQTSSCSYSKSPVEDLPHSSRHIIDRLTKMEDAFRFHGYSTLRIGLAFIVCSGIGVYIFREYIRDNVADEVSTVATKSLSADSVKVKAQELAVAMLYEILNDKDLQVHAVRFFQDVFSRPETQKSLQELLLQTLQDPYTQQQLTRLLKSVLISSLSDVTFRRELSHNLRLLLQDDNTKQGVLELMMYALDNPESIEATKVFLSQVIASQRVKTEAVHLGKHVVQGVVNDQGVQKYTGDALWGAIGYSVTPRWFVKSPTDVTASQKADNDHPQTNARTSSDNPDHTSAEAMETGSNGDPDSGVESDSD